MRKGGLTQKQVRFCDEYIIEPNATKAAINAGYSHKNARNMASKMLANVDIQEYIDIRLDQISKQYQVKAEDIIKDLLNIKNKCIESINNMDNYNLYRSNLNGALKALELICKHLGMFKENTYIGTEKDQKKLEDFF